MTQQSSLARTQMRGGIAQAALRIGAGIAGASTLALLAAGSLVPLMSGGLLGAQAVTLLSGLGANALASWLDTWAQARLRQARGDDPDAADHLLTDLTRDLQTVLATEEELQRDVGKLLGSVNALDAALESLRGQSDIQLRLVQQIAEDVQIGVLLTDDFSQAILRDLSAVRAQQQVYEQRLLIEIDKLRTTILQVRALGSIINTTPNQGAQGIFYGDVSFTFAAPEPHSIDLAAAQHLLEALPLDYVPETAPLPWCSRVLYPASSRFCGRHRDLQALAQLLIQEGSDGGTVAITGMGGLGKTSLATEFVHRYGQFFAGGVYWISCADPENIESEIAICGSGGLVARPDYGNLPLRTQMQLTQAAWNSPVPRLLIFDNCEDEQILLRYRPPTAGCRVLLTSRRHAWQSTFNVITREIDTLSKADSITLLQKYRPDINEHLASVQELVDELGHLPLALHLAGSYLEYYKDEAQLGNPTTFLAELRDAQLLDHPAFQGEDVQEAPTAHDLHIARTFALSYDQLKSDDAVDTLAQALLRLAACLEPGKPIPWDLLGAASDLGTSTESIALKQMVKARKRLTELGLLEQRISGIVTLHRLIAHFVRNIFTDLSTERTRIERAIIDQVEHRNIDGRISRDANMYGDQIQFIAKSLGDRADERAAGLSNALGLVQWQQGNYVLARAQFEKALDIRRALLGEQHLDTALCKNNLALVCEAQGEYERAHNLYQEALTVVEQLPEPEDLAIAQLLNNLALLLTTMKETDTASDLLNRALALREARLGAEHALTIETRRDLGTLLHLQGETDKAFQLISQVLHVQERTLDANAPSVALTLSRFAAVQLTRGEQKDAADALEKALRIQERVLGEQHPVTTQTLIDLADVLDRMGDPEQLALDLYNQALENLRRIFDDRDHALIALTLHNRAAVLQKQGETDQARQDLERALEIRERILQPNDPATALTLNNLAYLLYTQGELDVAYQLYERALSICRAAGLPDDHSTVQLVCDNLVPLDIASARQLNTTASILAARRERDIARLLFERTLTLCEQTLGEQHEMTQHVRTHLTTLGVYSEIK